MSEATRQELFDLLPARPRIQIFRSLGGNATLGAGGVFETVEPPATIEQRFVNFCDEQGVAVAKLTEADRPAFSDASRLFLRQDVQEFFRTKHPGIDPKLVPPARIQAPLDEMRKKIKDAGSDTVKRRIALEDRRTAAGFAKMFRKHYLEVRGILLLQDYFATRGNDIAADELFNLQAAYGKVIAGLPENAQQPPQSRPS